MSKNSNSNSSGVSSNNAADPGTGSGGYTVTSSGTNSQGNHYDSRDYGAGASNSNAYHYSNTDGSYYYSNSDGSTYHNNGQGGATYTPSGGKR